MSIIHYIPDWHSTHENATTRRLQKLRFISFPNNTAGSTYRRISQHPRASDVFTAWVLICEVASLCDTRGVLVKNGEIMDAEEMMLATNYPADIFELAFEVLTSKKYGWLATAEVNEEDLCSLETIFDADLNIISARSAENDSPSAENDAVSADSGTGKGREGKDNNNKNSNAVKDSHADGKHYDRLMEFGVLPKTFSFEEYIMLHNSHSIAPGAIIDELAAITKTIGAIGEQEISKWGAYRWIQFQINHILQSRKSKTHNFEKKRASDSGNAQTIERFFTAPAKKTAEVASNE